MDNPFAALDNRMTDVEKLLKDIKSIIQTPEPVEQTKYLTREDVANLLQINVSSVFNWTKKGILKSYQLGGRIYYKLDEIEAAMVELKK